MNRDGITDLVVAGRDGEEIATMLGNGNGTFTAAGAAQPTGGLTWVVVVGDMNGDGDLDAATANDGSGNVGVLLGRGDGTFDPVSTIAVGSHVPSVDLADLDGDGDLDMVVSSFGGGFWRWYRNNGSAVFTEVESFPAPANPSCAVLLDFDNDGDVDMALTDEIDDKVILMENGGQSSCSLAPRDCRTSTVAGGSKLGLKKHPLDPAKDVLVWALRRGEMTPKADYGDPTTTDGYALCLYEDDALVQGFDIPAGQMCSGQACWRSITRGYAYKDRELTPDGIAVTRLIEGLVDGKTRMKVRGKGGRLGMPVLADLNGVLDVQLQRTGDPLCWGATFTPPFRRHDDVLLKAISDAPPAMMGPQPIWSEIHAQVVAPVCGGCHGLSGGLGGLDDCNAGYASLVDVPSTRLPSMDRVEPGDPITSFLMHKLDGTQGMFSAQCVAMFCGSQMPLGGPPLSIEIRDAVRTWIMNGALNDCP
jgi:hypothetical protein